VGTSCECGNEPPGSIKCQKLLSGYTTGGISSSAQVSFAGFPPNCVALQCSHIFWGNLCQSKFYQGKFSY
jgi:hypothetical protein